MKRKKGFTLIELMVVISIIGILATIIIVTFVNAAAKSRDSKRKTDLNAISSALEMYFYDNKFYPIGGNGVATNLYLANNSSLVCNENGGVDQVPEQLRCLVSGGYISSIPLDPKYDVGVGDNYRYYYIGYNPGGTNPANYLGYKLVTGFNGVDSFEVSTDNATECTTIAGEFADLGYDSDDSANRCNHFQVNKNLLTAKVGSFVEN